MDKHIKRKAADVTLGYNKVFSAYFIQILSINFAWFLKDSCRKLVVNKYF